MCKWLRNIFIRDKEEGPVFEPRFITKADLENGLEVGTFSRIQLTRLSALHKCKVLRLEGHMQDHAINRVGEFIDYKNNTSNRLPEEPTLVASSHFNELLRGSGHEGVQDDFEALKSYGLRSPAEILAYGYRTASAVVKAWMASPAHAKIVTRSHFTYVGVAMRQYEGRNYWSVLFAR